MPHRAASGAFVFVALLCCGVYARGAPVIYAREHVSLGGGRVQTCRRNHSPLPMTSNEKEVRCYG